MRQKQTGLEAEKKEIENLQSFFVPVSPPPIACTIKVNTFGVPMGEEEGKAQGLKLKVSPGLRGTEQGRHSCSVDCPRAAQGSGLSLAEPKETQRLVLGLKNEVKRRKLN